VHDSSGPATPDHRHRWHATYTFQGQPGLPPGRDGLPGVPGLPDVHGATAADTFERLAAQVLTVAARCWWTPGVPPAMADFGETLLSQARRIAQDIGHWTYEPNPHHNWAHLTITHHTPDH
jgi:hypothetical protein